LHLSASAVVFARLLARLLVRASYCERRSGRRSARLVEDERLLARIRELRAGNYFAYG
jgi:hypothetical protein